MSEPSELDCMYEDEPVCPHCGKRHQDAFEWRDSGRRDCDRCGKPFTWERNVEVTYSTEKVKP